MAAMSTYLETKLLNVTFRNTAYTPPVTVYIALYTSNPTAADSGTEAAGASYARQAVTFSAPSSGSISNTADISFTSNEVWGTITHIGIRDALSGGNLLVFGALNVSKLMGVGDILRFSTSNLITNFS